MRLIAALIVILAVSILYNSDIHAQACERIGSSLSPCKAVQKIDVDNIEFHVQPIEDTCHPQLIFHGDFSTLRAKYLDNTIGFKNSSVGYFKYSSRQPIDFNTPNDAYWIIAFFGYVTPKDFDTFTLTKTQGYIKEHLQTNSISAKTRNLTDKLWLDIQLVQGGLEYLIGSNIVDGPPQLLNPLNEFATCIAALERGEKADALARSRTVQQQAIQTQLEIAKADKDFYLTEIANYEKAIETLQPIIEEANQARDDAIKKAKELQELYQKHLNLIKKFWDDTESAYGDYFNQLIDSQAKLNETVSSINLNIATVEQMKLDINKLIANAKEEVDKANDKINELEGE